MRRLHQMSCCPKSIGGNTRSDDEVERNMCLATRDASTRVQLATDNETRFLRNTKANKSISLKEHAVHINIARKKHSNRRSKRNLDGLYRKRTNIHQSYVSLEN